MEKIDPYIFRAYDIRGKYPQELNQESAYRIAMAFSALYPDAKKIVVARDPRHSSPFLFKSVTDALVKSGKEVINIGIAPDPLFYFTIFHHKMDGGIMISGSHNPKGHNGLTLHIRENDEEISKDVVEDDLEKIKELAIKGEVLTKEGGKITNFNPENEYIDYVTNKISLKKPLKVVVDSGNGACGYLPEKVFKKLGCQVKILYPEYDGNFPNHLPDPYEEENLQDIKNEVIKEKADIGFAYDTDGDRVGVINNKAELVNGDFCLLMLAQQALRKKKGPVVHDMRVSKAFLDEMKRQGVKTYFSISHHNAVIRKIIETNAVFGGEITLHFLFPLDYYLCDEAIFASLKIAEVISEHNNFAEYVDSLPRYCASPEIFIDADDDKKFGIIENLQNYLQENNYDFIDVDGARINFQNGWALARAANTTPIIKCRFEGNTEKDLIEIEKKALEIFKEVGIPITEKVYKELGL
ncbi:phosphomannomutase/phosphoglucomutase [Candidatus Parcubacteria bacterium]|nr:phosphomannomutase/phosphoglucomutase [Candidatus Parcubacteria bacterium]